MEYWSKAPERRDQLVLFPTRLEDVIEPEHAVRLLDEVLGCLSWSVFEAEYDGKCGRPPIPPRVLAAVTLYGLMTRIRSSRALVGAFRHILFRWSAEFAERHHQDSIVQFVTLQFVEERFQRPGQVR